MSKYNLSSSFLTPLLGLPQAKLYTIGFKVFLGDASRTNSSEGENRLYLELNSPPDWYLQQLINEDPSFTESYQDEGKWIFVKELTKDQLQTIVIPFREGRYSDIDREYVFSNFSKYSVTENGATVVSSNYLILTKSDSLRKYWEEDRGLELPEDAEVGDKPLPKNEIRKFKTVTNVEHVETTS